MTDREVKNKVNAAMLFIVATATGLAMLIAAMLVMSWLTALTVIHTWQSLVAEHAGFSLELWPTTAAMAILLTVTAPEATAGRHFGLVVLTRVAACGVLYIATEVLVRLQ